MSSIHGLGAADSYHPLGDRPTPIPPMPNSVNTVGDIITVLEHSLMSCPNEQLDLFEATVKNVLGSLNDNFVPQNNANQQSSFVVAFGHLSTNLPANSFLALLDGFRQYLPCNTSLYSSPSESTSQLVGSLTNLVDAPSANVMIAQCLLLEPQNPDANTASLQSLFGTTSNPMVFYLYNDGGSANILSIASALSKASGSLMFNLFNQWIGSWPQPTSDVNGGSLAAIANLMTDLPSNCDLLPKCFDNFSEISINITSNLISLLNTWKSFGEPSGPNSPFTLLDDTPQSTFGLMPAPIVQNFIGIIENLPKDDASLFTPLLQSLLQNLDLSSLTPSQVDDMNDFINDIFIEHSSLTSQIPLVIELLGNSNITNISTQNINTILQIIQSLPSGYTIPSNLFAFFGGENILNLSSSDIENITIILNGCIGAKANPISILTVLEGMGLNPLTEGTSIGPLIQNFPTNRPPADFLPLLKMLGSSFFVGQSSATIQNLDMLLSAFSSATNISNFLPFIQDVLTATPTIFFSNDLIQNLTSIIKAFGDGSPSASFISLLNDLNFFNPGETYSMNLTPAQMFTITSLISNWVSAGSPSDISAWLTQSPGGPTGWFYTIIMDAQTNLNSTDAYNVCLTMEEFINSLVSSGKYFDSSVTTELPLFDDAMTALLAAEKAGDSSSSFIAFAAAAAILNSFK